MAAASARVWAVASQLSSGAQDRRTARLSAPARTASGLCGLPHPTYAEGTDADEPAAASRRVRHYWRDRHAYRWRTQPSDAGGIARPALQGVGRDDPTGTGRQ